jgi:Crp-like helix-turn-helix domain
MGGDTTPSRAIVQSAGYAYELDGQRLKDEFHRNGGMQLLLLRYTQALITQMSQTAVCNRHHTVDQQLCRWLLLSLDRMSSTVLVMTQELIANMLGVRREGVTDAAGKLQKLGVIQYARGQITVLDRSKLEHRLLRVLCRRQERNRSPAGRHKHRLIASRAAHRTRRPFALDGRLQLSLLRFGAWSIESNPFGQDHRTDGRRVADRLCDRRVADPLSGCHPDCRHRGALLLRQHTRAGSVA